MIANNRNPAIDALRGFSILIVMVLHGAIPFPAALRGIHRIEDFAINGGYGVSIFFVVSGFLISSNTIKRHSALSLITIDQFYAMRIGRIFPSVAIFFVIYFVLFTLKVPEFRPGDPKVFYDGVGNFFQLRYGYFYITEGNIPGMYAMSPLWSLSIEEAFYLIFPIACFILNTDKLIMVFAVALVATGPFARSVFSDVLMFWGAVDLLAMGCIAAKVVSVVHASPRFQVFAAPLAILGVIIIAYCFGWTVIRDDFQLSTSAVGFGAVLFLIGVSFDNAALRLDGWPRMLLWPLRFLGRLSLPLYIFHVMARELLLPALGVDLLAVTVIGFAWILDRYALEPANGAIRSYYRRVPLEPQARTIHHRTTTTSAAD